MAVPQKITELAENTIPAIGDLLVMVDDPLGTPITKKIKLESLGFIDGWTLANETWTYATASTITVPTGATSRYQVGDKIKLTQTTVKYFRVVTVADTLLTVTGVGFNTYTVVNAAISANYYSRSEAPLGYDLPVRQISVTLEIQRAGYTVGAPGITYVAYVVGGSGNLCVGTDTGLYRQVRLVVQGAGNEAGSGKGMRLTNFSGLPEVTWSGISVSTYLGPWTNITDFTQNGGSTYLSIKGSSATENLTIYFVSLELRG